MPEYLEILFTGKIDTKSSKLKKWLEKLI
jgi:hypothetical protein